MALGFDSTAWMLCGNLVCLDAHLYIPGWREEDLRLHTGQGTLTSLRTRERGGSGRKKGGREKVEILINK